MADFLITALVERKRRLAALEAEVGVLRAEIDALSLAAQIIGLSDVNIPAPISAPGSTEEVRRSGGKPKGSISQKWRATLRFLTADGPHEYEDIKAAAELNGTQAALSSIRDRVRWFVEEGYMTRTPDNRFAVSAKAVEQFRLIPPEPEVPPSEEEGAPTS